MAVKSVFRRFLRILLIVIGVHAIVILGLHIWFVNNARGVLREIVSEKSKGKVRLKLNRLSFDFFSNKLQIREASLESTDTTTQAAAYHVEFRKLTLRIHSFWPLVLQKKLLLDSIKLHDPVITVNLLRKDTTNLDKEDLSVPKEMGKLYNSMLDVLDGFGIRLIVINNATLSLVNRMKPESKPVTITNVYLEVLRSANARYKRDDFVEQEQTVDLRTTHQNLDLPGGRHRLAFKTFNLHLFRKYIELDSCTITAKPTAEYKSSYSIFFSKLLLIGVDFNAMYRDNLIRADSVYCENPLFDINLIPAAGKKKKERPDPERIVRELTGDLDLAFVGVKDAGIHININGERPRSLFNSNQDNFEMRGLKIFADSSAPVTVQQFDMLVRDYRLYNEDSSTVYSFDSVKFKNNKIVLNNFSVTTTSSRTTARSERDYRIPYFELTGLDWYQLVFDETVQAREAVLYNPVISYTKNPESIRRKRTNFFASLQSIDNLLTLDKINIIQGQINMKLGPSASFTFENVNLSLSSDKLLKSTNKEGLRKAVTQLHFTGGVLKWKDITARLSNIQYTDSNLVHAGKVSVTSTSGKVTADIDDMYITNMLVDDDLQTVIVDGLKWKSASVNLRSLPAGPSDRPGSNIEIKNISGSDTRFQFENANTSVSSLIKRLKITSLTKPESQAIYAHGLSVEGNDLTVNNQTTTLRTGAYHFRDDANSFFSAVSLDRFGPWDSVTANIPRIDFRADINELLAGNMHISHLVAPDLDLEIRKWQRPAQGQTEGLQTPIVIDSISAPNAAIAIALHRNDSVTKIELPRSAGSNLSVSGLTAAPERTQLNLVKFRADGATITQATGQKIGVEEGQIEMELEDIQFTRSNGNPSWNGLVKRLYMQSPTNILVGNNNRNSLFLSDLSLGNLRLSSEYLTDFREMVKYNISAWLRSGSGRYVDSTITLKWYNAGYDNHTKTLSLDSFRYFPTRSLDSVITGSPYQTDYITFSSGQIELQQFNVDSYRSDTALIASTVNVTHPEITIYRDKRPGLRPGVIKPLPVTAIERIPIPVSIDRLQIHDGRLTYIEKNAKTRAEAVIYLTGMNGSITDFKNRNVSTTDSLGLFLTAYLLDSAFLDLRVKESYTDSLSSFRMNLRVRPTSLSFLNPVLTPLSNVIITSGTVDSLHLDAIGREYSGFGKMKMYYHDLRVKLVKPGSPEKTTLKTRLLTSIANGFVIKKNNRGRTGIVYFERLRDRSFFNYIVKMTLNGIATSVGYKSNRKMRKQYERQQGTNAIDL